MEETVKRIVKEADRHRPGYYKEYNKKHPERHVYASGKSLPAWYDDARCSKERQKIRSKTFTGIAKAMAEQWSAYLT